MTLADFLLARYAEEAGDLCHCCDDGLGTVVGFARADLEAKRRIVEKCRWGDRTDPTVHFLGEPGEDERAEILELLALPYADHPDYDESWRP